METETGEIKPPVTCDTCGSKVTINEGGFADCANNCAYWKLDEQDLGDWIAALALAIENVIERLGDRASANTYARLTALDIVKERVNAEFDAREAAFLRGRQP